MISVCLFFSFLDEGKRPLWSNLFCWVGLLTFRFGCMVSPSWSGYPSGCYLKELLDVVLQARCTTKRKLEISHTFSFPEWEKADKNFSQRDIG